MLPLGKRHVGTLWFIISWDCLRPTLLQNKKSLIWKKAWLLKNILQKSGVILFQVTLHVLFRENLNQPSLSPSGFIHFPGGKTKLQRGNFTYRGWQSSWMTEQGFRSNSFKTEPQTKESSGRAIFVVKSIILKYTLSTYYYVQKRRRESLNYVSHDHLQRQNVGNLPTEGCSPRGSGVLWGGGQLCHSLALCRSHNGTHPY